MTRCTLGLVCLVLAGSAGSCGKNSARPSRGQDDGGLASEMACEAQRDHVTGLYRQAALAEELPANLQTEYVASLVHMVMNDCRQSSRRVSICLDKSESAREIETECLLPLDDAGDVEGKRFAESR